MKKLIIITTIAVSLVGCHHNDNMNEWTRNEYNKYPYYSYETKNVTESSPIYVSIPGYGSGYNEDVGNMIKKYLNRYNLDGMILLPYVNYKNGNIEEYTSLMRNVIDLYKRGNNKVYIIGESAGGCLSLSLSSQWSDVNGIIPIVAGAYKDGGGTPTTELDRPGYGVRVWFLNGYDESMLKRYGIYWDGTVFVDPTIRLYNELSGGAKMTLIPGVSHSSGRKLLTDEVLMWLRNN